MARTGQVPNLTEPRENIYFAVALVISIAVWIVCAVSIVPLLITAGVAFFVWLANGLLVAQLKADAVKVGGGQMGALAETFARVCRKMEMTRIPELYVLQSGGLLNAFTTRHGGRNFVVVFSELLEAYGPDSPEIEFLLGHELGHIRRSHILKRLFLAPGLLFPLLGNAYSRACEFSCDRHGAYAASRIQGAINAMMVLAGGRQAPAAMDAASFAGQYAAHRGFFVSWYELISGYPTLSHRLANLLAIADNRATPRARRNLCAYPFALFTLGGAPTGGANAMITIFIVALLAAIAVPAFVKARTTAREKGAAISCASNRVILDSAKEAAALARSSKPGDMLADDEVAPFLKTGVTGLVCRAGGHYTLNPAGQPPECSVHGSTREEESESLP